MCDTPLDLLIDDIFQKEVSRVDLESDTKDLPFAHFDAETFLESNKYVINISDQINAALSRNDFEKARPLAGEILHTLQDL